MSFGYPENQQQGQQGPPLEVSDFSGGKTDVFLDGPINSYKEADNLVITENAKIRQRRGTLIFDEANEQTPGGNNRVAEFVTTDLDLFSQVARNLYYIDGTWQTLTGPTGNPAFTAGDVNSKIAWSEWNKHYILTNSDFSAPQKHFVDDTGTRRLVQAGLPSVTLWSAIDYANSIQTTLNAHIGDLAGGGADHNSSSGLSTASPAFDFDSLLVLTIDLTTTYDTHDDDAELALPVHHIAQEASDHSLDSLSEPTTLTEAVARLDDLKAKLNSHDADTTAHTVGSTHQVTTFSEPQFAFTPNSNNYIYTILYFYEYKVGTVTFQDAGPVYTHQILGMESPDVGTVTITGISDIVNGSTENYDTVNIVKQVYRTQANGTTSTLVGELADGFTTFVDTFSDADIADNIPLYTNGGIQSNDGPPKAKFNVTVNNSTWYGHVKIGSEKHKSRLYQSIAFDPDSVPASFFIDIEDEILGLGAINIYPIVFCKNHIYRIEGGLDELGAGVLTKREISRTIGGINHLSIVDAREGLFFAGNDGFYFTDGFNIQKLTDQLDDSYRTLIQTQDQKDRITGQYEKEFDRIYWAVSEDAASPDNDSKWVLDLKWGVKGRSTFTTISNEDSWAPSAMGSTPDEKTFVIGDRRGYVFKYDANTATDPKIDLLLPNTDWNLKAIIYDFEWIKTKFDTSYRRKWVTGIVVNMENVTNLSLQIKSENDNSGSFQNLSPIRFRENITWGDESGPAWGDYSKPYLWKNFPIISAKRRFPRNRLRTTFKSVAFTNAITIITTSDSLGLASIDNTAKTATLENVANAWPSDIVDQFLTFSNDGFETQYLVTSRDSDLVVTYQDVTDSSPNGVNQQWEIKGIAKGEVFAMSNFSIQWLPHTPTHLPYRASDTGEL